jgi:hypothetical protein
MPFVCPGTEEYIKAQHADIPKEIKNDARIGSYD